MASEELIERLGHAASIAESGSRWYEKRPREGRALERFYQYLAIKYVLREIHRREEWGQPMTDRDVARHYPEIVKPAVTRSMWERIKPEGWEP